MKTIILQVDIQDGQYYLVKKGIINKTIASTPTQREIKKIADAVVEALESVGVEAVVEYM